MGTHAADEKELLEVHEPEEVCIPWERECGRKAEWLHHVSCCSATLPLCGMHKQLVDVMYMLITAASWDQYCRVCKHEFRPFTRDDWWFTKI